MQNNLKDVEHDIWDIVDVVKRQKYRIIAPFLLISFFAAFIAIILPTKYRSVATILIEEQEIPVDFLRSTITRYVEQQLEIINQRVMSRSKLMEIIDKFKLYREFIGHLTTEEIIEEMRDDIEMEQISVDMLDKRTGRPGKATIAFTLSYEGKEPYTVQKVANSLTSLFLEENYKSRTEHTKNVSIFFENEKDDYLNRLKAIDEKIAKLKSRHIGELPESSDLTIQMIDRLERDLSTIESNIKSAWDRKVYLEGQLASVIASETGGILSKNEKLNNLKAELISLKAKFSDKYPDVKRVKEEIESLEKVIKDELLYKERVRLLEELEEELTNAKGRKKKKRDELKSMITTLKAEVEELKDRVSPDRTDAEKELNPNYLTLRTQITQAEIEIESLKRTKEVTREKIEEYQRRLEQMPQLEQEYNILLRDRENTAAKFQELEVKLMEAKMSENVEREQKGESFTILDPPILPEEPFKPNRIAIIFIGIILGMGAGTGYGFLAESMDRSFKSKKDVLQFTDYTILGEIPVIITPEDRKRVRVKVLTIVLSLLGLSSAVLILFNLYIMPLDIFWIKLLRAINTRMVLLLN